MVQCVVTSGIIMPQRSTAYVDAAYRYRPSSVVCLPVLVGLWVCRCVGLSVIAVSMQDG